jgi:hypothetical protein
MYAAYNQLARKEGRSEWAELSEDKRNDFISMSSNCPVEFPPPHLDGKVCSDGDVPKDFSGADVARAFADVAGEHSNIMRCVLRRHQLYVTLAILSVRGQHVARYIEKTHPNLHINRNKRADYVTEFRAGELQWNPGQDRMIGRQTSVVSPAQMQDLVIVIRHGACVI